MAGSKKASTNGSSRRSKSNSLPPAVPPTSDDAAIAPSSDSLALPSASAPSSKKLFPLFDNKARGKKAAPSQLGTSDVESNANLSESSQTAEKKTKKATNPKGKSKSDGVSNGQKSDAPTSLKNKTTETSKAAKTRTSSKAESMLKKKTTKKSKSPPGEHQVDDLDMTISTVASTSTSSTTPPPSPHKTVITITDSPVREMRPTKTFADLEAERQARKAAKEAGGWNGGKLPLWPSRGNSHVQPADAVSGVLERVAWPKRDWKGKGRAVEANMLVGEEYNTKRFTNVNPHDVKSIVQNYTFLEKQAETTTSGASQTSMDILDEASRERLRLVSQDQSQDNCQQTWYQRYAPLRATDVLGDVNIENAVYLRDWLQELTLQDPLKVLQNNSRKRKIKREVTSDERKRIRRAAKRRKRKGYDENDDTLDDFIAPDDELDEEDNHYDYYDFDELPDDASLPSSPTKSTTSSQGTRQHSRGRFEQLTNVILLAGPVSSGKTSTAYAVANELGWQVFEVYPGIGKRGFKDLERYVGMVGENHIMKREAPPVSSFFSKAANAATPVLKSAPAPPVTISSNGPSSSQASVPISINTTEGSINGNDLAGSASTSANNIKQSCILIEEVDILYESDSGFWEGLISLIAKSRRPVILTCNDVNAVPKDSLPLQEILHFQALSTSVSIALLEEIANLEGKNVGKDVLETIVRAASSPGGEQVDIRQAINQLQYNSTVGSTQAKPLKEGDTALLQPDLRVIQAVLETASFADAELSRRTWMAMEDNDRVSQPAKEDDEFLHHPNLPVHKLDPPPYPDPSQPLPCYAREAEFCSALGVDEHGGAVEVERLHDRQWQLCNDLYPVVDELLDETSLTPRDTKAHLDILPALREIVALEDMKEIAWNVAMEITADDVVLDARIRRSRRLAGGGKASYRRQLDMSREVIEALKRSRFAGVAREDARYSGDEGYYKVEEGSQVHEDDENSEQQA